MDETRLCTIEQLQPFLSATPEVVFTAPLAGSAADNQRYEHISRVLTRFDYPLRKRYRAPAAPFAHKYTAADVEMLVEMDRAHEDVCGRLRMHPGHRGWGTPSEPG